VLVGHPRASFLLHTDHTVDTLTSRSGNMRSKTRRSRSRMDPGPMIAFACRASNRGTNRGRQRHGRRADNLSQVATTCREPTLCEGALPALTTAKQGKFCHPSRRPSLAPPLHCDRPRGPFGLLKTLSP
jgi:hypothetical protein